MTPDYWLLAVGLVLCVAGISENVFAGRKRRADRRWLDSAVKTEGVVSRTVERKDYSGPSDSYGNISVAEVPIVRFRASNGHEYEIDAPSEVGGVGAKVPVAYNPDLPSDARALAPNVYRGGCGYILLLIGLGLAVKAMLA